MRTELPGSRSKPQTAAQDLAAHIALGKIVKITGDSEPTKTRI